MTRQRIAAFAVIASLLMVSMGMVGASPQRQTETAESIAAAGSGGLVVVSQHTSETDFQQSQELTNLTVTGSGVEAGITLQGNPFTNPGFETGDLSGWSASSDWAATTEQPHSGSYAANIDTSPSFSGRIIAQSSDSANVSGWVSVVDSGATEHAGLATNVQSARSDGYVFFIAPEAGDELFLQRIDSGDNTVLDSASADSLSASTYYYLTLTRNGDTLTGTVYDAPPAEGGTEIASVSAQDSTYTGGDVGGYGYVDAHVDDLSTGTGSPSSARYVSPTHSVTNAESAAINITQASNVSITATVRTTGGTVLNQTTLTTTGNHTLTLASTSSSQLETVLDVSVTGTNPRFTLADESILFNPSAPTADSAAATPQGGTDFNDESVTVSVPVNDSDFATAQGDSVTVDIYVDGSVEKTTTITSNQTVSATVSNLADGSHTWHVELNDSYGESTTSTTWSFEVSHYPPQFDNSTASPSGGKTVTERTIDLSISLSDVDFAESSGDEVQVEYYVDGSKVATKNVTSNGTVTASVSVPDGGNHTWHAEAVDEYGQTATSDTFKFKSPAELRIYNETNTSELLDNATTEIRFYFEGESDLIVTRNTTDGTLNMTGLPTDKAFVVTADAPGYQARRIYVTSLVDQQSIYLLPESAKQVKTTFKLKDYTGKYPESDTVLVVQRAINDSWTTVEGDFFGATGSFPTHLKYNTRHRLVLINTVTGEREEVGTYTPLSSSEQTVRVLGDSEIDISPTAPSVVNDPGVRSLMAVDSTKISVRVDNESTQLEWWNVTVIYKNGSTETVLASINKSGPSGGTFAPTLNLTGKSGGNVTVVTTWKTKSGKTDRHVEVYQVQEAYQNQFSLFSTLGGLPLPADDVDVFTLMVSMFSTVLITAGAGQKLRLSTEQAGLVAVGALTGFSLIGWVGYSLVFVSVVGYVSMIGIRRGL